MGQFQRWTFGNAELIAVQDTWSRLRPDYFFPEGGSGRGSRRTGSIWWRTGG